MDIPRDVLEKFKCVRCSVYLSRGPVYLEHEGAALCGRCFTPELPATRNTQYEAVAPLLRFPCRYSELGCGDIVPFVQEDEVLAHEEVCAYRQWVCPVLGPARCDWQGPRADIMNHCQDQHPDRVLYNQCHLEHDITKSSDKTFLLRAFQLLFLLHTKVCVNTANIYHCVRHLGSSEEAMGFTYNLVIKRNDELLLKRGQVAPQGSLTLQEDTSLVLDINDLRSLFGGFTGALFTVEVKRRVREVTVCLRCEAQGSALVYRDEDGWKCERCGPPRRACMNKAQGCNYRDINKKCKKHELYFCQQRTKCLICRDDLERGLLSAHYNASCTRVYRVGATWQVTRNLTEGRRLVSGAVGIAVYCYKLDDKVFDLSVHISVSSELLKEFQCVVRLTQPATGLERVYRPDIVFQEMRDWHVQVRKEEFPMWDYVFDVTVDIK